MGRSPAKGKRSKVREIAAATVRLAKGGEPPPRARIRALYPDAHHDTFAEGYRIGCLDLVLAPGGEPLTGETAEERDQVKERVARLGAWRLAHPAYYSPAHTARRAGLRGRAGPLGGGRFGDSPRGGPGSPGVGGR